MDNSGFLKSVSFGGFDKKDVLAYVDDLNTKIYTLEAELEEKRSTMSEDGGSIATFDGAEKYEEMLAKERSHSSESLAKIDTLNLTVQSLKSEIADKDIEIEKLSEKISDLESNTTAQKTEEASSFDIGNVFIEAKKSADKIILEAKNAAKKMDLDSKELAKQVVDDANGKAMSAVTEAETKAGKVVADAETKANKLVIDAGNKARTALSDAEAKANKVTRESEMKNNNLKRLSDEMKINIQTDMDKIFANVVQLNDVIADFSRSSTISFEKAKTIITDAQEELETGVDFAERQTETYIPPVIPYEPTEIKDEKPALKSKNVVKNPEPIVDEKKPHAMGFSEMAEYAKSLQDQIEAEAKLEEIH